MGVYIKGMTMPTDRSRWVVIYPDGKVEYSDKTDEWETLDKGAIPVPPHGRLVDADANIASLERCLQSPENDLAEFTYSYARAFLSECPTIIEAEEGE